VSALIWCKGVVVRCRHQITFALVAVFVLFFSRITAANLLQNPGFEIGPAHGATPQGWWKYNECGQEWWAARSGTNGMSFWSWSDGTWGGFGQDVNLAVAPGDVLTLSVWALAEPDFRSSQDETWIKIEYWTNGATARSGQIIKDIYAPLIAVPDQWNRYTLVATNTLDNVSVIKVVFGGGGFMNRGGRQAVKWDDAELTLTSPPPHDPNRFPVQSAVERDGTFRIHWIASTTRYYQVWAADTLDGNWRFVRGMVLGADGEQLWRDEEAMRKHDRLFYKIVGRPLENPQDLDDDGVDDVTELRRGMDPTSTDTDGDGVPDGEDPRPTVANEPPEINEITFSSDGNYHDGEPIAMAIQSEDADGDAMLFRYAVNGGPFTGWQSGHQLVWSPSGLYGRQTLTIEVRDIWGAVSSTEYVLYIFRTPPRP